jgi:hypothetical protein
VELRNRNQSAILRGGNHRRLLVIIRLPKLEFQRLSRLRRQSCFADLPSHIHAEDPFTGEAHLS